MCVFKKSTGRSSESHTHTHKINIKIKYVHIIIIKKTTTTTPTTNNMQVNWKVALVVCFVVTVLILVVIFATRQSKDSSLNQDDSMIDSSSNTQPPEMTKNASKTEPPQDLWVVMRGDTHAGSNGGNLIAAGLKHVVIYIRSTNRLFAFGDNSYGQLGLGSFQTGNNFRSQSVPVAVNTSNFQNARVQKIACGDYFTYLLLEDGRLISFGDNRNGQLSRLDTDQNSIPLQISNSFGTHTDIVCGGNFAFAVLQGWLLCTGSNQQGALGLPGQLHNFTTFQTIIPFTHFNNQFQVGDIKHLSCGADHTVIVLNDGRVFGTGATVRGQLADITRPRGAFVDQFTEITNWTNDASRIQHVECVGANTWILREDGSMWGVGDNTYHQLTPLKVNSSQDWVHIDSGPVSTLARIHGGKHVFTINPSASVLSWGSNASRQLGIVSSEPIVNQPTIVPFWNAVSHTPLLFSGGDEFTVCLNDVGHCFVAGTVF